MAHDLSLLDLMAPATGDWSPNDFGDVWAAVTGHHGKPVSDDKAKLDAFENEPEGPACLEAAKDFCGQVHALFEPLAHIARPGQQLLAVLSWHVSAVTVVADWIGSNRAWFPYRAPDLPLTDYWTSIQPHARDAIADANVIVAAPNSLMTPQRLLPEIAVSQPWPKIRASSLRCPQDARRPALLTSPLARERSA